MKIEIKQNEKKSYDLYVNDKKYITEESMGVCDSVKYSLQHGLIDYCPTEADEIAEGILKAEGQSMSYKYSDAEVEGIIKMRDELAERGTRLEKENRELKEWKIYWENICKNYQKTLGEFNKKIKSLHQEIITCTDYWEKKDIELQDKIKALEARNVHYEKVRGDLIKDLEADLAFYRAKLTQYEREGKCCWSGGMTGQ